MEGGQASSESAIFSLPVRTRGQELEQLQLLEGSKYLTKKGIREKQKPFFGEANGPATPSRATTAATPSSNANAMLADKNLTNVLLQLLVTEITSMRCTLDSLAKNEGLSTEIQRNNKLLALLLTSGHSLENFSYLDYPQIVKRVQEKVEEAEVLLKIL